MEITKLPSGIKVKTKNTTFIVDPQDAKLDADVVMLYDKPQDYSKFAGKLVIDSPGEYEIGGTSVRGSKIRGSISYDLFEDGQKLTIISNPDITGDVETEDSKVALVKLSEKLSDKALSSIQSEVVSFYGNEEFLPQEKEALKRMDKINLKKTEDLKGYLVYLSK
jgi:hypothetical protein